MTVPDGYLVGAPKAGTTTVAGWLEQHPDVYFSVPKEPFHWAADYPRLRAHYGFAERERYERLFASPAAATAALRMEGSTLYLYSRVAIEDIFAERPDARVVVMVRDPVDLLVSYHRTQLVALNERRADLGDAWRQSLRGDPPPGDPLDPKLLDYPRVARLGAALRGLYERVPREQVHVVVFDDLVARPQQVWDDLLGFLGLTTRPAVPGDRRNASDKSYRSALVRRALHRPPEVLEEPVRRLRTWSRETDSSAVRMAKRLLWRREPRPTIDGALRAEVAGVLRPDVDQLAGLLGRDLSHWASSRST